MLGAGQCPSATERKPGTDAWPTCLRLDLLMPTATLLGRWFPAGELPWCNASRVAVNQALGEPTVRASAPQRALGLHAGCRKGEAQAGHVLAAFSRLPTASSDHRHQAPSHAGGQPYHRSAHHRPGSSGSCLQHRPQRRPPPVHSPPPGPIGARRLPYTSYGRGGGCHRQRSRRLPCGVGPGPRLSCTVLAWVRDLGPAAVPSSQRVAAAGAAWW